MRCESECGSQAILMCECQSIPLCKTCFESHKSNMEYEIHKAKDLPAKEDGRQENSEIHQEFIEQLREFKGKMSYCRGETTKRIEDTFNLSMQKLRVYTEFLKKQHNSGNINIKPNIEFLPGKTILQLVKNSYNFNHR